MSTALRKNDWPVERECPRFYGDPSYRASGDRPNASWESANLVRVSAPFKMYYAGKLVQSVRIHRKCAESLTRIFAAIWGAAGKSQKVIDQWGVSTYAGTFNYRPKRGGSVLSMHAYGCAIDLDPARNAHHDTTPNFAIGPQHKVVEIFEAEGWTWGGRWKGRSCDGMHFQAADNT
jgi:hypothetical protein